MPIQNMTYLCVTKVSFQYLFPVMELLDMFNVNIFIRILKVYKFNSNVFLNKMIFEPLSIKKYI